ncbi:DUF423 domain-containing protein [Shivajiella indica]|uniref:DUF423 domain-containing protein n=1 Tax=Shivajiella indica TaxID=872115 RepID=A0ABW5BBQ7_9BACT
MKNHQYLQLAAILGALAVGIGAFGAHGLKPILEANAKVDTFETAVKYHFYHTIAILILAIWLNIQPEMKKISRVIWSFFVGILIFSGSLYFLSLTGINWLGAITPIGGLFFIYGWLSLIWLSKRKIS